MTFKENLLEAAYNGPVSGTRIPFKYRDVLTASFQHRTDEYSYVGLNGSEKRTSGIGAQEYPMQAIFQGKTHDTDSEAFLALLAEQWSPGKPGVLEHPRKGIKEVCIKGTVNTVMDVINNGAETWVNVTFEDQLTPPSQKKDGAKISGKKQFDLANTNAGKDFESNLSLDTSSQRTRAKFAVLDGMKKVNSAVADAMSRSAQERNKFDLAYTDIVNNVDTLVKTPIVLAAQMQQAIHAPFNILMDVVDRANLWRDLYADTFGGAGSDATDENKNEIAVQELICNGAVSGTCYNLTSSVESFQTSQQAYDELRQVRKGLDNMMNDFSISEENFKNKKFQEQYFANVSTYSNMMQLIAIGHQAIQQYVSGIKTSFSYTLTHPMTLLALCHIHYDDVSDETLMRVINSNKLSITDCYMVPAGRTLVF